MISYIIVDDEPLAHQLIEEFCGMLPHLKLQNNCYSAMEAMEFLNQQKTDIMFLDLNMPKLSGFDFLRSLTRPPAVIVTTAYKEHALEGYQLNVVDYLLKPFSFDRLVKAINKAIDSRQSQLPVSNNQGLIEQRFFVKGDKKHHQVRSGEILYVEGHGNYARLVLKNEIILSHHGISYYESLLSEKQFLRVHRSFIVALDKIKSIEGNRVIMADHEVPIGQTYRSSVSKLYGT